MKKLIFSLATLLAFTAVFAFTVLAQNWTITDKYSVKVFEPRCSRGF